MANVLQGHVFGNKSSEREVQEPTDAYWTRLVQLPARETHSDELACHSGWTERSLSPRKLCGWFCKQAMEKMPLELGTGKETGGSLGLAERESLGWIYLNAVEARDGSQLPTATTACLFLFISGVVSEPQSLGFDFTPGNNAAKSLEL